MKREVALTKQQITDALCDHAKSLNPSFLRGDRFNMRLVTGSDGLVTCTIQEGHVGDPDLDAPQEEAGAAS